MKSLGASAKLDLLYISDRRNRCFGFHEVMFALTKFMISNYSRKICRNSSDHEASNASPEPKPHFSTAREDAKDVEVDTSKKPSGLAPEQHTSPQNPPGPCRLTGFAALLGGRAFWCGISFVTRTDIREARAGVEGSPTWAQAVSTDDRFKGGTCPALLLQVSVGICEFPAI